MPQEFSACYLVIMPRVFGTLEEHVGTYPVLLPVDRYFPFINEMCIKLK